MFTENLAAFFDTDAFATTATIGTASVSVIFDAAYAGALGVAGSAPTLLVVSADVAGVARGDAVTISGSSYTVTNIEPDGTGLTRLTLQEA